MGNDNIYRVFASHYPTFYIYFSTNALLNKQGLRYLQKNEV